MTDLPKLILCVLASLFKSKAKLEAEILVLRQQINVLRRRAPKRLHLNNTDRFLFVWLYRWFPSVLGAIAIVKPETIIRWHRAGFRAYWRWRSRNHVGRPKVSAELRTLIGEMSRANPLWGAPHIHGESPELGFEVARSTVARCPWRIRKLRCDRHLEQTAAMVPPSVVIKDGMGGRRFARSFSWSTATERLMNAIFVVINSQLVQLSLQVDCVPD